jgi:hypothetical protein
VPIVVTPAEVGGCSPIALSAANSLPGGAGMPTYEWGVNAGASVGVDVTAIGETLGALGETTSSVTLQPSAASPAGSSLGLTLTLTSFLGVRSTVAWTVLRSSAALPAVAISGTPERLVRAREKVVLVGSGQPAPCWTGQDKGLVFEWSLLNVSTGEAADATSAVEELARATAVVERAAAAARAAGSASLALAAYSLRAGHTYTLLLSGSMAANAVLSSSAFVQLLCLQEPLRAVISGGTVRRSSATEPITLDASASIDPNSPMAQLSYSWALAGQQEGALGRFPCSPCPGRRGRCPALPLQPHHGYAADLHRGLHSRHQ